MSERTAPRPLLYASAIIALLLSVLPLPGFLAKIRPDFLLLVVIWFALMAPRAGGLLFAWFAGLALDAFRGVVLGQHALAFVIIGYITHRLHLRVRMFTLLQQALFVFAQLAIYQFILFWIDGVTGHRVADWTRWLPVFTGALLWPVLMGFMGRFLTRL